MTIQCLPLGAYQTNCYLVWGKNTDSCIVIDPGYSPEKVLNKAKENGKTVAAVLLTHGHFDHVGGVQSIAQDAGCPVYLHEKELSQPEEMTAGPLYYTNTYGEGDVLDFAGLTLRVLHTPGHTPGSVCLLTEDALFSGDTLFQDSCGRTDFPGGSLADMFRSLRRLVSLNEKIAVLPGHGPATTIGAERQDNPYVRGRL